jgi:hypothetical protein
MRGNKSAHKPHARVYAVLLRSLGRSAAAEVVAPSSKFFQWVWDVGAVSVVGTTVRARALGHLARRISPAVQRADMAFEELTGIY